MYQFYIQIIFSRIKRAAMKKYITSIIVLAFYMTSLSAQTEEVFSIFSQRYHLNNPAAMGLDGYTHINLGAYQKWFGIEDNPQTFFLASSSPLLNRSLGLGGTLVIDKAAGINTTRLNLNASVHINPASDGVFSIGASAAYLGMGLGTFNVPEALAEVNSSIINLGIGLNYHQKMKDNSFFNFRVTLPRFPRSFDLSRNATNVDEAAFTLSNEFIVQANLKYAISDGTYFTPSFRYYTGVTEDSGVSKSQVIDLGLGVSFLEDAFNVRLGFRTTNASAIYGGIGYRFNQKHDAFVYVEPVGDLGTSAAFDADFILGEAQPPPERSPKKIKPKKSPKVKETKEKPVRERPRRDNISCYKDVDCIVTKIQSINSDNIFDVRIDKSSKFEYVIVGFAESRNNLFNYFEDDRFLSSIALDKLLDYIKEINEEITKDNKNIGQITLKATIKKPLDGNPYAFYKGKDVLVEYWEEGKKEEKEIKEDYNMNEAELAAVKLHYLKQEFTKEVLGGDSASTRIEVVHKPGADDYRYIEIILVIR